MTKTSSHRNPRLWKNIEIEKIKIDFSSRKNYFFKKLFFPNMQFPHTFTTQQPPPKKSHIPRRSRPHKIGHQINYKIFKIYTSELYCSKKILNTKKTFLPNMQFLHSFKMHLRTLDNSSWARRSRLHKIGKWIGHLFLRFLEKVVPEYADVEHLNEPNN